jgi:hypothetical protein
MPDIRTNHGSVQREVPGMLVEVPVRRVERECGTVAH